MQKPRGLARGKLLSSPRGRGVNELDISSIDCFPDGSGTAGKQAAGCRSRREGSVAHPLWLAHRIV